MAVLPLPPGPSPFLPPPLPFPVEQTSPPLDPTATAELSEEWQEWDEPTGERVSVPILVADLHQAVSRAESSAHAAEALLQETSLHSPAGPSRRAHRIVDHLTSAREANLRALELIEALSAELTARR